MLYDSENSPELRLITKLVSPYKKNYQRHFPSILKVLVNTSEVISWQICHNNDATFLFLWNITRYKTFMSIIEFKHCGMTWPIHGAHI